MSSLYQLTHQMQELLDTDDVSDDQLTETFGAIEKKAENVCQYLTVLAGQVDVFKAEEKRLAERRKALENQQERIREYIKQGMATLEVDKLKAGTFSISVSPSAGSVVIDCSADIPPKFLTIVPECYQVDKAAIKAAIKAGQTVPGAHVEPGTTLKIR